MAELVVYDLTGPRGQAVITAAADFAAPVEELRCFWDLSDPEGARLGFWGPDGAIVASFPSWYRADCDLARFPDGWLPLPDEEGPRGEDFDTDSFVSAQRHEGWVYVFQADLTELTARVSGTVPAAVTPTPGTVEIEGLEASWYRMPLEAFRDSWGQAQGQARRMVATRGGETS